ncbi:MAG: Rdx family protein [Tepidanaerobacteraceae bacterium]|jgi:hypothetical protein|nr:Rdx family protein [Tepidanaerobacteraceae bacterium]
MFSLYTGDGEEIREVSGKVTLDGKLIFSKEETGRFPEPGEVENKIIC